MTEPSSNWRDSEGGKNFLRFATMYKCNQCKKKFDQPWVVPTGKPYPDHIQPNPDITFHWFDSHGFPEDMFYELVMNLMFRPQETRQVFRWFDKVV